MYACIREKKKNAPILYNILTDNGLINEQHQQTPGCCSTVHCVHRCDVLVVDRMVQQQALLRCCLHNSGGHCVQHPSVAARCCATSSGVAYRMHTAVCRESTDGCKPSSKKQHCVNVVKHTLPSKLHLLLLPTKQQAILA